MKIAGVDEIQALDREASETWGIPELLLMENAALAAVAVMNQTWGLVGKKIVLFCGVGNNGGDGLAVARKILSCGGFPTVALLGDPGCFAGPALANWTLLSGLGIPVMINPARSDMDGAVAASDGVVDALFGTGLTRPVEGLWAEAIRAINAGGRPVCSLDIPSGVSGQTGQILGEAVQASLTVTFGLPKIGNLLYPGFANGGRLFVSRISYPPALYDGNAIVLETNDHLALPARDPMAHKGTVGDCLFVAGAAGYYGAPLFSTLAFLKAGGGYARLAAPRSIVSAIAEAGPEIVFLPQEETSRGTLGMTARYILTEAANKADVVVVGPGLSLDEETQRLVRELAAAIPRPLILDGDGLTAVAADLSVLRNRKAPTILTPHLGEMARLTGCSVAEIERDRIGVLRRACDDVNAVIVLKGPHSLIGCPGGQVWVNLTGNAGMATAGSGDVLAGTIAAMAGLGMSAAEAARKGVWLHGLAGDLAARDKGMDGITARDILETTPEALARDRAQGAAAPLSRKIVLCP